MISRLRRRLPSPAFIVACVALFVAFGGTSYAFAIGSVGTREIRDNSIRSVDVHNRSLKGTDFALDSVGGDAVKEQSLDPSKLDASKLDVAELPTVPHALVADTVKNLPEQPQPLTVFVTQDGSASLQHGVSSVVHHSDGKYTVTFNQPVANCVPAVTISDSIAHGDVENAHTAALMVRTAASDPNAFDVNTANFSDVPTDHAFYMVVFC